jgi:hypothetical protein
MKNYRMLTRKEAKKPVRADSRNDPFSNYSKVFNHVAGASSPFEGPNYTDIELNL